MSDLIQRLREPLDKRLPLRVHNERREAADEIERLRANLEHYEETLCDLHYKEAALREIMRLDAGACHHVAREALEGDDE